jgi:hypothetical protein
MLSRRSSSFRPAELRRAVLTPIGERHGIDYDTSTFAAPSSPEELGFEAVRCCTGLVMAFAYEDAWPDEDRALRKLGRKAAALVRDSVHDTPGRDAVTWAASRFGRVMADLRRRAAQAGRDDADAYRATADADERLAGLVAGLWPVDEQHPAIAYARELRPGYEIDNPDALIDLLRLRVPHRGHGRSAQPRHLAVDPRARISDHMLDLQPRPSVRRRGPVRLDPRRVVLGQPHRSRPDPLRRHDRHRRGPAGAVSTRGPRPVTARASQLV